jgi:hypothetical protein
MPTPPPVTSETAGGDHPDDHDHDDDAEGDLRQEHKPRAGSTCSKLVTDLKVITVFSCRRATRQWLSAF